MQNGTTYFNPRSLKSSLVTSSSIWSNRNCSLTNWKHATTDRRGYWRDRFNLYGYGLKKKRPNFDSFRLYFSYPNFVRDFADSVIHNVYSSNLLFLSSVRQYRRLEAIWLDLCNNRPRYFHDWNLWTRDSNSDKRYNSNRCKWQRSVQQSISTKPSGPFDLQPFFSENRFDIPTLLPEIY